MRYFTIVKIDHAHFKEFIDFTNEYADEDWGIILDSVGGVTSLMKMMTEIINSRPDRVKIYCNNAYSAAFDILMECKKVGRVWFIATVLKTVGCYSPVSSNLTSSAFKNYFYFVL